MENFWIGMNWLVRQVGIGPSYHAISIVCLDSIVPCANAHTWPIPCGSTVFSSWSLYKKHCPSPFPTDYVVPVLQAIPWNAWAGVLVLRSCDCISLRCPVNSVLKLKMLAIIGPLIADWQLPSLYNNVLLKASSSVSFGPRHVWHIFHCESGKVVWHWLVYVLWFTRYLIFVEIAVSICFPWQANPVNLCGERHEAGSHLDEAFKVEISETWQLRIRTALFDASMHQWI